MKISWVQYRNKRNDDIGDVILHCVKVSKYGVISGPYFPVFGLNTGKYGPEITPYLDTFHAVLIRQRFLEVIFSGEQGDQFDSSTRYNSQRANLILIYNFIKLLNNLFKVGWGLKNADIICNMLRSLVSLQQGNVKKSEKLIKIINIVEKNIDIFWPTWGISVKLLGKM